MEVAWIRTLPLGAGRTSRRGRRGIRGTGRAIVTRLAADGAHVTFEYARDRAAADPVEQEVRTAGGVAVAVRVDLADLATVEDLLVAAARSSAACWTTCRPAALQFTRVGARELGPRGITVNTVSPARPTPRCCAARLPGRSERPWRRRPRSVDIAAVAAFLTGPDGA